MMDQAKLKSLLIKRLEKLDDAIAEKVVTEKTDAIHMKELERDMFAVQDQLLRLQAKLKDQQQEKTEAEAERQKIHEKLEAAKKMHSKMTDKLNKEKVYVSLLETKVDRLLQHLAYTQEVHEDLRSKGKAMKHFSSKAEADKAQAKVDKLKQELYVDRLTKDLEKVTQQAAMYKIHTAAQARQTQELKQVLSETESVKGSLVMEHNQLFKQWNSSLMALEKQDKAFNEMQEALRNATFKAATLHKELVGYNKSIKEEKERYKALLMKLNRLQLDDAISKNVMGRMQAKKEDLQAQYSTCLNILQDLEHTRDRLKKESRTLVDELNNQRKMFERESALRLELEGKIMAQMQQKLIHSKLSKQPSGNISVHKKEKISQLWQIEKELKSVGQECSEIIQHLDSMKLTQEALEEDIIKNDKLILANQATMNSLVSRIRHNHAFIDINNKKIQQIRDQTGNEVLSPLELQVETLAKENKELAEANKKNRQLWERQQGVLIQLAQEKKASTTVFLDLQTKYCVLNQKKIRLEGQIALEHREKAELVRHLKTLMGDRLKLNNLISKNTQLSQALELENALKESDNLCIMKEAEREHVELKMKQEGIEEEKEMLQNYMVEADMQVELWERKIQLLKETRAAVDSERGDIDTMKAEIHNKEVWLTQLKKQQLDLQKESSAAFARRESVLLYRDVMVHSLRNKTKKEENYNAIKSLKRRIKDTHKDVAGAEQKIRELQEGKESLSNCIGQQRRRIMELRARNYALDHEIVKLQDDKDRNLFVLIALQNRAKQLKKVCDGTFQGSGDASSDSVDNALQHHQEFVHASSTILHRVCEEFPQYRVVVRRPLLMLEAQQELSKV